MSLTSFLDMPDVTAKLKPWVEMSQRTGITLIILHHTRKTGGEYGLGVAGGSGSIALVDHVIQMDRDPDHDERRFITATGRGGKDPDKATIGWTEYAPHGIGTGEYRLEFMGAAIAIRNMIGKSCRKYLRQSRRGSCATRYSHSRPLFCIQSGARRTRAVWTRAPRATHSSKSAGAPRLASWPLMEEPPPRMRACSYLRSGGGLSCGLLWETTSVRTLSSVQWKRGSK